MTYSSKIEEVFDDIFVKKAPTMPKGLNAFFRDLTRYLAPVGAILILISLWQDRMGFLPHLLLVGASSALLLAAWPALLKMQKYGWNLLFYSALISTIDSFIEMVRQPSAVLGFVFFVLFEILGYYITMQFRKDFDK